MNSKFLVALVILLSLGPNYYRNYLKEKRIRLAQENVIKLMEVETGETGGATGFVIVAPSGEKYTLTNAHVCHLSKNGKLKYTQDNVRFGTLDILEISKGPDLCILSKVPNKSGLHISNNTYYMQQLFVFGHPLLDNLTFSTGIRMEETQRQVPIPNVSESECRFIGGVMTSMSTMEQLYGAPPQMCIKTHTADRTNVVIFGGNSGSPVMDSSGSVVGVVFAANAMTNQGLIVTNKDLLDFIKEY